MGGYCFESVMPATNDVLSLNDHFLGGRVRWPAESSNGFCTPEHGAGHDRFPGYFHSDKNQFESA